MLFLAIVSAAGAVWRALVAAHHYRLSLAVVDDPSMKELEQVSAAVEGGISLILLFHAGALIALSRRPLVIKWPYAIAVALVCAVFVSGSLLSLPVISWLGIYPLSIVASVALLSHFLMFGWVSLYLGTLSGSVLAWYAAPPVSDPFACLAVVVPCIALAFLGAGLRHLLLRHFAAGQRT
jgi:hypothetical protein